MNVQETTSPNKLRRKNEAREHQSMAGCNKLAGVHSVPQIVLPQEALLISLPLHGHVGQRPGRNGTSVSSCIAPPLGGTVVFLGCSLGSVGRSSIWFQTKCCSQPTLGLPSPLPSLSPPKVGQRVPRRSSFATDQRRLEDGKGKSGPVHIQVASPFS